MKYSNRLHPNPLSASSALSYGCAECNGVTPQLSQRALKNFEFGQSDHGQATVIDPSVGVSERQYFAVFYCHLYRPVSTPSGLVRK